MKILLVSSQDYIHHPVPSRHHYIFEELATRHEIHVAHFHVSNNNDRATLLIPEEVTMFNIKSPFLHYTLNAPYHFYKFDAILHHEHYDAVVVANILAGTAVICAANKYKVPVVFDLKDWFPDSAAMYIKNNILKEVVRMSVLDITKYNLERSNKIVTVSPSLVKKLNALGFESELITNGVDTSIFKPMPKTNDNDFVIGFVGSVERWYGLDEIIKAMPKLLKYNPNMKLLIVGDSLFTEYGKELKSLVNNLNLFDNVIFTGLKPYNELPHYISMMDVCAIPPIPPQWRNIALPNKFFEYTACGKPIITTPIPDMIAMGTDNLFVYKNIGEYVEKIKYIENNKPKVLNNIENFDWKNRAKDFEKLIKEVTL
ncbi:MAG: glycosyltransferase family 4 protein [Candidatus Paceibacterota bacterium]|jgi:glycosyltransferase involved in cell wall biosynthesis